MSGKKQNRTQSKAMQVFEFIHEFQNKHGGIPPTRREIMDGENISSLSVTNYYLVALQNMGLVKLMPGLARGILVVDQREKITLWSCPVIPCSTISNAPGYCVDHPKTKLVQKIYAEVEDEQSLVY